MMREPRAAISRSSKSDPEQQAGGRQTSIERDRRGRTVVFDYNGRVEKVNSGSEQDLTNALIKVTHGQQNKV